LFEYLQWKANLAILGIEEVRTIPYCPVSHPFIERKIGTIRREYLDHVFYWNAKDLKRKLRAYQDHFNELRIHQGIAGKVPNEMADLEETKIASIEGYRWQSYCNGLFQMPEAA